MEIIISGVSVGISEYLGLEYPTEVIGVGISVYIIKAF